MGRIMGLIWHLFSYPKNSGKSWEKGFKGHDVQDIKAYWNGKNFTAELQNKNVRDV